MAASIDLFPNSGHQYCFVPFEDSYVTENPEIDKACVENREPWKQHATHKWLRYRRGRKGEKSGLWLAVESNLGNKSRGITYPSLRPPQAQSITHDEFQAMQESPYAAVSDLQLPQVPIQVDIEGGQSILITWKKPNAAPIDVDLVVDFGNTRSVAFILENNKNSDLRQICHPVRFTPRASEYAPLAHVHASEDPFVIIDSWTILHEAVFSQFEPPAPSFAPETVYTAVEKEPSWKEDFWGKIKGSPKKRLELTGATDYVPQMFVELSPSLIGGGNDVDSARRVLHELDLTAGANYFLSSPKRYAWDTDEVGVEGTGYWNVVLNRYSAGNPTQLPRLSGPILMFMDTDGRDWTIDQVPNERKEVASRPHPSATPTHPRSDALTWVALAIIERAYFQINSENYRKLLNTPYVPRRLRSILVTFPAGWTGIELKCYLQKWQKAINIFTAGHLQDRRPTSQGGERPDLITTLDEAVASQLPIIYSEIQRLRDGETWIELMGRGRSNDSQARIMNVDIGGGTTDVSIVEYQDTQPGISVHLNAKLLFKNSNAIAGDALAKRIIETILLPILGSGLPKDSPEQIRFIQFFSDPPQAFLATDSAFIQKMARITRLVLLPIVNEWLKETAGERYGRPEDPGRGQKPSEMTSGDGTPSVDAAITKELNELSKKFISPDFEVLPYNEPLNYNQPKLRECIDLEFKPLIQSLTKLVGAFGCDLVIVSGKPSELPDVRRLLCRELPLLPQQIVSVKNFPAGSWYPLGGGHGAIQDAKTITAVGAALYQAMQNNLVPEWRLECSTGENLLTENYWGEMPPRTRPEMFDEHVYLKPGQSEATTTMSIGTKIGRKRFPSPHVWPDQIYRLRWKKGKERPNESPKLEVTLRRETPKDAAESLAVAGVRGADSQGKPITTDDIDLQLCTLPDNVFWMDNPRFNIRW